MRHYEVVHGFDTLSPTFGSVLKEYRVARGWTQQELAERAGVSVSTICNLEQGALRRPRRDTLDLLASALDLLPQDRLSFVTLGRGNLLGSHAGGTARPVPLPEHSARRYQLPVPPTPLLGRDQELSQALALLARPAVRLLTLVGVGGCGKTHLGIEVARTVAEGYPDGAWYVSLAPVRDPDLFPAAIAEVLDISERGNDSLVGTLAAYLSTRHMLLVLDNFEHLAVAASQVAAWLQSCPYIEFIVTSRRALHIRGEYELPVPPLELPDLKSLPAPADLARVPAVELFLERTRATVPSFALTDWNASAVAGICHRLDGLPLALELAAPLLKTLTPETMLERLSHRLDMLKDGAYDLPERQRSLRATLVWSHDLLNEQERWLFRRMAVFAGGASMKAVEALCSADNVSTSQTDSMLIGLQASSLVQECEGSGGETRFTLLETVREFAWSLLAAESEAEAVQSQHASYFLSLAEGSERLLRGREQIVWIKELEEEHNNLRAALRWLLDQRAAEPVLRMTAALRPFWYMRGYLSEGCGWLEQALRLATEQETSVPGALYAKALNSAGVLAFAQGDFEQATIRYEQSLAMSERLQDYLAIGNACHNLGIIAQEQGNLSRARELYLRSLSLREATGDRKGVASALNGLGIVARLQGDLAQAAEWHGRSLAIRREQGDEQGIAISLNNLANVAIDQGNVDRAETLQQEALAIRRRLQDSRGIVDTLNNLASIARARGGITRAQQLAEEAADICRRIEDKSGLTLSLIVLATAACEQEDVARAADLSRQCLQLSRNMKAQAHIATCLERLAYIAWKVGSPDVAAMRLGSAEALRESIGVPVEPRDRAFCESTRRQVCSQLGPDRFVAACSVGRDLPLEQVMDEALGETV